MAKVTTHTFHPASLPTHASNPNESDTIGTWFDNRGIDRADVGAGSGHSAYRWRPLNWNVDDSSYVHERTVGTARYTGCQGYWDLIVDNVAYIMVYVIYIYIYIYI